MYPQRIRDRRRPAHFRNRDFGAFLEFLGLRERASVLIYEDHQPLRILRLIVLLNHPILHIRIILKPGMLEAYFVGDYESLSNFILDITRIFYRII